MVQQAPPPSFGNAVLATRVIASDPDLFITEMDFHPGVQDEPGVFDTGALLGFADGTSTRCAGLNIPADMVPRPFPLSVKFSASVVGQARSGIVRGEARPIHRERNLVIVETTVLDADGAKVAIVTTTHVILPNNAASRTTS